MPEAPFPQSFRIVVDASVKAVTKDGKFFRSDCQSAADEWSELLASSPFQPQRWSELRYKSHNQSRFVTSSCVAKCQILQTIASDVHRIRPRLSRWAHNLSY